MVSLGTLAPPETEGQDSTGDRLPQSFSRLPLQYGRFLDPEIMQEDPFYALHGVFQHVASSECLMLDMIQNKVESHSKLDLTSQSGSHAMLQSTLLHFQEILEQQIAQLEGCLDIIKRRGARWWPKAQGNRSTDAQSAAAQTQEDFECLIHRAKTLLARCERTMAMVMNMLSIEEARRSVNQNTTLFRFTVVASIYIPLSFTSSFFGMNFIELGQGSLRIWVFFATCVPIFLVSVLCLFVNLNRLQRLKAIHKIFSRG